MRCAVLDAQWGFCLNIIVADPEVDPAPPGCVLWPLADDECINDETVWTVDGPVNPPPNNLTKWDLIEGG